MKFSSIFKGTSEEGPDADNPLELEPKPGKAGAPEIKDSRTSEVREPDQAEFYKKERGKERESFDMLKNNLFPEGVPVRGKYRSFDAAMYPHRNNVRAVWFEDGRKKEITLTNMEELYKFKGEFEEEKSRE